MPMDPLSVEFIMLFIIESWLMSLAAVPVSIKIPFAVNPFIIFPVMDQLSASTADEENTKLMQSVNVLDPYALKTFPEITTLLQLVVIDIPFGSSAVWGKNMLFEIMWSRDRGSFSWTPIPHPLIEFPEKTISSPLESRAIPPERNI